MQKQLLREAKGYARNNVRRRLRRRFVRVMACIVVFCTTYALILPAIAMEKNSVCEMEEHTHSESCYKQLTSLETTALVCTRESLQIHRHTESCYGADGQPICGLADFVVHTHNEACYDAEGTLVCPLPVIRLHEHTEACYLQEEPAEEAQHEHDESCYTTQQGELLCQVDTEQAHVHGEACGSLQTLSCGLVASEGHTHTEECKQTVLVCDQTEEAHVHEDSCYQTDLVCGMTEEPGHSHGETCYTQTYACGMEEGAVHIHGDSCYAVEEVLTCQIEQEAEESTEPAGETTEPTEPVLICEATEIILHIHSDACYKITQDAAGNERRTLTCGKLEIRQHSHGDDCFVTETVSVDTENLTCGLEECHVHDDGCYDEGGGLICAEPTLGHVHTAMCYGTWTLICELEEHTHTEDCEPGPIEETEPLASEECLNTLSYMGDDYEVILRFDEAACIPANAELVVVELAGEEYQYYLEQTYQAIGDDRSRMVVQFDGEEVSSEDATAITGAISFARFFDLTILVDGEEIEPKDTVQVTIRYAESVAIPDGEKTAVHFTQNGEVEILNAESIMPMRLMSPRSSAPAENAESKAGGGEFVFLQDSFSVTGTITLGKDSIAYDNITEMDWFCGNTTIKTLTVYANFGPGEEKSILIKVPTGFRIVSYSATEDTPEINGVTKVQIDNEFKDYVLSSELMPASTEGSRIVGVTHTGTWESQALSGYTGYQSNVEQDYRTHGGDIKYTLSPNTQTVRLVVSMHIDQKLLSHTSPTEDMDPIEVIIKSDAEEHKSCISVTATDVPVVNIGSTSVPLGGKDQYNVSVIGEIEGYSDVLPICATSYNFLYASSERDSYFEELEFCLTYPAGVFLEPDSVFFEVLGFGPDNRIPTLVNGETKVVVENHLSVYWEQDVNGGGKITWTAQKGTYCHASSGVIGADFRANTDISKSPYFEGGDTITGFELKLVKCVRNTKASAPKSIFYRRTLIPAGDVKDIRLMPRNFTRRDITADFRTDAYDFALGGYDVYSALSYPDNTFYFENVNNLKITALNLMGKNIRNITVVTNNGVIEVGEPPYDPRSGENYHGHLLKLSQIGGVDGEYIKACLFTADFDQTTYQAGQPFGAFVYIGQFQDGDGDGNREGDVTLRQLHDNTTYDEVQQAIANGTLDELTMVNGGKDEPYGQQAIVATDHTTIGWTNTGVGAVTVSVKNPETDMSQSTYYANDRLRFETVLESGYKMQHQDMLIDPVLVISLPKGLSLDTSSVIAFSAGGTSGGNSVQLKQYGHARETTIKGVTWKTYQFRVAEDQRLALVATEKHLHSGTGQSERIRACFDVVVDPVCGQYDLSLQDIIMWDVRNTAYEEDTLTTVTQSGVNGDAVASHWSATCTRTDKNNFLGHGTSYGVANNGGTIVIKPLIGLNVDLGIKPVANEDDPYTVSGFTTYNGLLSSIAPVIPDKYADVRVNYQSTSDNDYFKGTVIYIPIPKKGLDYTKYFENVNLTDPMNNETAANTKTFGFTMDLTGPVELSNSQTTWKTYYARPVSTNPNPHEIITPDQAGEGIIDTWEPVVQNGGKVEWLEAEGVGNSWNEVAMLKFVADDNVSPNETGSTVMRLYVHDLDSKPDDGPALGGTYNYWRGYSKAVTDFASQIGNWKYTSVVAATPAMETLVGQIFVDKDRDGLFDDTELNYIPGKYTAELSKVGGGMDTRVLVVNEDGSFALVDSKGVPEYLPAGSYTVTIRRNSDPNFHFANTNYNSSIGMESPESEWHNNVSGKAVASWQFEVTNTTTEGIVVHRIGVGLKAHVNITLRGSKTLYGSKMKAGDYSFSLQAVNNAPVNGNSAKVTADGDFAFGTILYEQPGTYQYKITEDCANPHPGILYDYHTTTVTVEVTEDSTTGILTATVSYDNSTAKTDKDRAVTEWAAFTNAVGYELPQTGGAGTYLHAMGGLLLMMAAAVLLHTHNLKRRKKQRTNQ